MRVWPFHALLALVALCLTAAAAPLQDLKATYRSTSHGDPLVIELAATGDRRVTYAPDTYSLLSGGSLYWVHAGPGGPIVTTSEAQDYIVRKNIEVSRLGVAPLKRPKFHHYQPIGTVSIGGRSGTAWRAREDPKSKPVVFSDDPDLARLGTYWANYDPVPNNLAPMFASKGVLAIGDLELASLDLGPIDPARLRIPAKARGLDDVLMSDEDWALRGEEMSNLFNSSWEQVSIGPMQVAQSAMAFDGKLLVLSSFGGIRAWDMASHSGVQFDAPDKISDFCKHGNELWLFVADPDLGLQAWHGNPGSWKLARSFEGETGFGDTAIDCSGSEPLVLTGTAIHLLESGKTLSIPRHQPAASTSITTHLQHGGNLYVGLRQNGGPDGSGEQFALLRYPLGTEPSQGRPSVLCSTAGGKSCPSLTGLIPDPAHPQCLIGTSTQLRYPGRGSILQICDGTSRQVYGKPFTLEPDWHFDPDLPFTDPLGSVQFVALAQGTDSAWAVGTDGIYNLGKAALPDFTPYPNHPEFGEAGIYWGHPDVVLITLPMTRSYTLGGRFLLIVPR